MAAGVPFLIDVTRVREWFPDWWLPVADDFSTIVPGRTRVKVRALIGEGDGGATLESARSLWVRVDEIEDLEVSGLIEMSTLDHPDWQPGGPIEFHTTNVWDICDFSDDGRPMVNVARARTMIDKLVIIGITKESDPGDGTPERTQLVGAITRVDADELVIRLLDGEEIVLPPDIRGFENALPGDYRLKSTGEVIVDPDFTAFLIYAPGPSRALGIPRPHGPWQWSFQ